MNDLVFIAVGFSIVALLCIAIWFDHKRREKQKAEKRKLCRVLDIKPYLVEEDRPERWIL